jgi:hypothetical protein
MKHKRTNIRKPMPPPSVAHRSYIEDIYKSLDKEKVDEAIKNFHDDPADKGWDWDSPSERGNGLWEIK